MPEAYRPRGLSSAVCYQDAKAAFQWLEEAFGFEPLFVLLDAEGNLGHSEMTYARLSWLTMSGVKTTKVQNRSGGKTPSQFMSSWLRAKIWTLTASAHALPGQKSSWNLRCSSTVTARIVPGILKATFGLSASRSKE